MIVGRVSASLRREMRRSLLSSMFGFGLTAGTAAIAVGQETMSAVVDDTVTLPPVTVLGSRQIDVPLSNVPYTIAILI